MRSRPALLALLALPLFALQLAAQEPAAATGWEGLRVTIEPQSARVLTAREGTVLPARTVTLQGGALEYRFPASPFTVGLQVARSTRSGDLAYGLLGGSARSGDFSVEGGYGWRSGYDLNTGLVHGRVHHFARLGGAWEAGIPATALSVGSRFGFYVPLSVLATSESSLSGWEGESGIVAELSRLPLTLGLAFRFERFRVLRTEQEASSIRFSLGWRVGGNAR